MSAGNQVQEYVTVESNPYEFFVRNEIARLEEGLPEMKAQRESLLRKADEAGAQILRVEGGLAELYGLVSAAEKAKQAAIPAAPASEPFDTQSLADAHAAAIFADAGILTEKA
jgi:hypothetical protein